MVMLRVFWVIGRADEPRGLLTASQATPQWSRSS